MDIEAAAALVQDPHSLTLPPVLSLRPAGGPGESEFPRRAPTKVGQQFVVPMGRQLRFLIGLEAPNKDELLHRPVPDIFIFRGAAGGMSGF